MSLLPRTRLPVLFRASRACKLRRMSAIPIKYIDDPRPQFFVSTKRDLEDLLRKCESATEIGFDTEFTSFPLYKPKVELMQLSTDSLLACVDCASLQHESLATLAQLIASKTLIMHACEQDLAILRSFGGEASDIFDTQIAAGMAGIGSTMGLDRLTEALLDISVDKSETLSDWRLRPLTRSQLSYAFGDVQHLHTMRTDLLFRIMTLNRMDWFAADMQSACQPRRPPTSAELYKTVRRINKLRDDAVGLIVLQDLANYREEAAAKLNIAPMLILRDDLMVAISKKKPTNEADLHGFQGMKATTIRFHGKFIISTILGALARASTAPALTLPPHLLHTEQQKNTFNSLKHLMLSRVHSKASEMTIASDVLASDAEIGLFALTPDNEVAATAFRFLRGWRLDVIGRELLDIRMGRAHVKWNADAVSLQLLV